MRLVFDRFASPVDDLTLVTDEEGRLRALEFDSGEARLERLLQRQYGLVTLERGAAPDSITGPLTAYFAGDHGALDAIVVATAGTPFQRRVWAALRSIPAGRTMSYGALAASLGQPGASRAVGLANGSNPVAIVVPCHRVIGADASLTGFGGGLHRKRWLLEHEGVLSRSAPELPLTLMG